MPARPKPTRKPSSRPKKPANEKLPFPIVAIGASAGGLDAFRELLRALPADTGMSFVLLQHLDPTHPSLLAELLGRETPMPVTQAQNGEDPQPNRVYVIPPDQDLSIFGGRLQLVPRVHENGIHLPIDYFFRALALESEAAAIAVVLSGTGSDGVRGLREIKAAGGMTMAQDPSTAEYDGMPRAAIGADVVDVTGSPTQIAEELERIAHHPLLQQMTGDTRAEQAEAGLSQSDLTSLYVLMRASTGVDFSHYKVNTIRRRVERRILLHQVGSLEKYLELLREDSEEVQALYRDLLINVTQFFRDPEVFDTLRQRVFPEIVASKSSAESIRVWVTGCSTGEEVYSLLITLLETLDGVEDRPSVTVFGTDISDDAIARARAGIYPSSIRADVSPGRLARFFTPLDEGYQVNKSVREMCVFARQDITRDPPFSRMDLVSMRNVLIYMDAELQKRVMGILHYSLVPQGFLLLGTSETVGTQGRLFTSYDKAKKVYRRKDVASRLPVDLPQPSRLPFVPESRPPAEHPTIPTRRFSLQRTADEVVLGRYAPPRVIIDGNGTILHFYGDTSPFLEHPSGRASLNLLEMARDGLAMDIKELVDVVRGTEATFADRETFVRFEDGYHRVSVEAAPIISPAGESYVLVAFRELPPLAPDVPAGTPDSESLRREEQLRRELSSVRKHLQQIIEEKDDSNEELRAANEEIQSSNEELQSINEELETAKEELQSTNEELTTINDELGRRNIELAELNDDLNNFLNSVDLPMLMLGSDLAIRRFTPQVGVIAEIGTADIGRPVSHLRLHLDIDDLEQMAADVARDLRVRVSEVQHKDGRWFEMRIGPYTTGDKRVTGVVIRFYDIDAIKRSLDAAEQRARLSGALNEIDWAVASTLDVDDIMQRAVVEAAEALGAETSAIASRQSDGWRIDYAYGLPDELIGVMLPDEENSHAVLAASTNQPVAVAQAQADKRVNGEMAKRYNIRSTMVVPLEVREEPLGVFFFNWHSANADLGELVLDFARRLGSIVSLGLENARLYERERRVAETLQEAVLSMAERVAGVDFAYLYCPASDAANVGGDFYDVFHITGSQVGLLVGDVAGKGLPAARMTSLARDSMRSYAIEGGTPIQVLARANEVMRRASGAEIFVTMFFGILDTETGDLTYCNAGHPPGVLRRADGSVEHLEGKGTFLGAYLGFDCEERHATLADGDVLVLYTDGLTEVRSGDDQMFGHDRLGEAVAAGEADVTRTPLELLERVLEFSGGELRDDAVVLAAALGEGIGTRLACPIARGHLTHARPATGGFAWPGTRVESDHGAEGTPE